MPLDYVKYPYQASYRGLNEGIVPQEFVADLLTFLAQ